MSRTFGRVNSLGPTIEAAEVAADVATQDELDALRRQVIIPVLFSASSVTSGQQYFFGLGGFIGTTPTTAIANGKTVITGYNLVIREVKLRSNLDGDFIMYENGSVLGSSLDTLGTGAEVSQTGLNLLVEAGNELALSFSASATGAVWMRGHIVAELYA